MMKIYELQTLYGKREFDNIESYYIFILDNGNEATLVTKTRIGNAKPNETRKTFTLGDYSAPQSERGPFEYALAEARLLWQQKKDAGYTENIKSVTVSYYCECGKGIKRNMVLCSRCSAKAATRKEIFQREAIEKGKCRYCGSNLQKLRGVWQCVAYATPANRKPEYKDLPKCSFVIDDD